MRYDYVILHIPTGIHYTLELKTESKSTKKKMTVSIADYCCNRCVPCPVDCCRQSSLGIDCPWFTDIKESTADKFMLIYPASEYLITLKE